MLDAAGEARPLSRSRRASGAAAVLQVLPLSSLQQLLDPRRAFAGLWAPC